MQDAPYLAILSNVVTRLCVRVAMRPLSVTLQVHVHNIMGKILGGVTFILRCE